MAAHDEIALTTARQGIVLLKNEGALPLATDKPLKIAVIGGYAELGAAVSRPQPRAVLHLSGIVVEN
jgi:beta-glucosidase-like glycosyl hydrolase